VPGTHTAAVNNRWRISLEALIAAFDFGLLSPLLFLSLSLSAVVDLVQAVHTESTKSCYLHLKSDRRVEPLAQLLSGVDRRLSTGICVLTLFRSCFRDYGDVCNSTLLLNSDESFNLYVSVSLC